jgi:flagellar biosynthesis GTPase FlhF
MRNYRIFPTLLICLIGTFLLVACGGQSTDSESVSTSAASDNAFKQALQEQVSDMKDDKDKAAQQWKELEEEEERERAAAAEQERLEKESAPYGYNEYGEPYASRDHKNLDKALNRFEEARQGYINATYSRNPMDLMFYHKRMKNEIEDCLYYARSIGDRDIINEIERLNRQVDNLQY